MIDFERTQNEIEKFYKEAGRIKECFHHRKDECKGKIKQAHSIQKNGKLSILESEVNGNMSVYTFANSKMSFDNVMDDLSPIGKKEASTFFGFCDFHDSKLFSKIENYPFDHSAEQLFLHSYRSFAHSYHLKNEEIKAWNDSKYQQILISTYGKQNVETKKNQFAALGEQLLKRKTILEYSIDNGEFDNLNYLVHEFDGIAPLAVSSLITPVMSFSGGLMNNSDYENLLVSQPIFTLLPENDYSILILAAFNFDTASTKFIDEINSMPRFKFEKAISSIIIDSCQNTIFSPKFWNRLTKSEKRLILDEYAIKSMDYQSKRKVFWSQFNFFKQEYFLKKGST
jgi:cell fate (sporulation/competence/biofilm development) regulator YlbF (YheA/YmcA/DUF963 family)